MLQTTVLTQSQNHPRSELPNELSELPTFGIATHKCW